MRWVKDMPHLKRYLAGDKRIHQMERKDRYLYSLASGCSGNSSKVSRLPPVANPFGQPLSKLPDYGDQICK